MPPNKSFKSFSVESPAKINLLLKITGIRKDGYHNIASIFQMIDLCDTLTFSPQQIGKVRVACSDKSIPLKKNLVWRAAMALYKPGLPGVKIHVKKVIPSGAGLGGGSSNAATVLYVLNQIWRLGLTDKELRGVGAKLGADVPFFLFAPRAWVYGIGDKLSELPNAEKFAALLVKPRQKVSTVKAYKDFDLGLTKPLKSFKMPARIRVEGFSLENTAGLLQNDLEVAVFKSYPALGRIRRALQGLSGKGALLTGSGSAMFVLFAKKSEAEKAGREVSAWKIQLWSKVVLPRNSMGHLKEISGEKIWK
jgi:4-diphosphocytidyl-2-C-methyl-D-erythritol kinase